MEERKGERERERGKGKGKEGQREKCDYSFSIYMMQVTICIHAIYPLMKLYDVMVCLEIYRGNQLSWPLFLTFFTFNCSLSMHACPGHSTIQYLGFGLSGSTSFTSMFKADATIAWVDGNGMAQAQDYYLSNYVQVGHMI